jgi:hypothetical protein
VNSKPAGNLARAWKTLTPFQIFAGDAERNLRNKLFADGNFGVFREPDFHIF